MSDSELLCRTFLAFAQMGSAPFSGLVAASTCGNGWRMTDKEQSVLDALLELEGAVEAMRTAAAKPNLLPHFARLDELTRALPITTDPLLLHYLHKRSYQKARLFLQGRDAANARGNCLGHVDERGRPWDPNEDAAGTPSKDGGRMPPAR